MSKPRRPLARNASSFLALITRPFRLLYAAWVLWCLDCNETWMHACEADGIVDTMSMREWRKQASADRVRIMMLVR